jgi:hypothetical protein
MSEFRLLLIAVCARLSAVTAAASAFLALSAHAAVDELFAVTIPGVDGWVGETSAVGDPLCTACPCNSMDSFAFAENPTTIYLEAINFENFTLPAGHVITNVHADVMCRYDTGQVWDIQIRYGLNGVNDQLLGNFELGSSSLTTCRYRTGAAGNITAPAGGWTAAAVNSLRVKVRQQQGASRLRVKAFRLTVTYVPIDSDGDGTPDINDCAPNDPAIATPRVFYRDLDGDGFGNPGNATAPLCQLNPPAGYVANSSDCNDTNAQINPNTIWYLDADGDGFGDPNSPSAPQCVQPTGYVLSNTDLCPTDPAKIAPGPCGCEVPETDINANGVPDCTESTSILRTVWSTSVPNATGWTNASNAASATQPTCGESCNCDSGGSFASSTTTEWLEATDFASMNIPQGYSGANVRVDVQCRADNPSNCTIRVEAYSGSTFTYLREKTFATADGQCRYRLGRVFGYMETAPSAGWTASALEAIRVRVRRPGGAANTLRVKSFRVQALLVERDTDHDGLTDSIDPCPSLANGPTDCNGNGLGDTCEIALSPSTRDVNGDGVLDSCQGIVGWVGGSSGSFSSASSWTSGSVPGPSSNVFLSSASGSTLTLSTSSPVTISTLTVTSGTVKLNLGANFAVTGNIAVNPGASLIVDGVSANRFFDVGGNLRVRIGSKFEIGSLASVRVGTLGSMVTDPLSTVSIVLREGNTLPLSIQGAAQFENGILVKIGSIPESQLTVGRQFSLMSVGALSGPIFRSLGTQSSLQGKFMRSVVSSAFGGGLLAVEVSLQSDFINSVGGSQQPIGAASIPTALVTRNFNPTPDVLDDIAVCARKYAAGGAEVEGSLFVFQSAASGTAFAQTIEYATGIGPVAIASEDLDLDGDMDIAVLNTVSGTLQVFVNGTPAPSNSIDRFTISTPLSSTVTVGDDFLAIARNQSGLKDSLAPQSHSALIGNSGLSTLRAIQYLLAGPVKGNPQPTSPLGPPGPSSPIDDTSRTDGWFAGTFRQSGAAESGALAKVEVVGGKDGLPEPLIDAGSIRAAPPFPVGVETSDFNSDGFMDAVVVGANGPVTGDGSVVAIYSGASVGVFASAGALPLPARPLDATVGLFDSDGKSDLLIAFGVVNGDGEVGEFARLYQNTVPSIGSQPQFENNAGDNLFAGAGVRRVEAGSLNALPPDDVAVMGETIGFSPSLLGGVTPYGAAKLLEVAAIPPDCVADLTGDQRVDSSDLGLLLAAWGTNGIADINGDETVDSADLALILVAWGNCP